MDLYENSILDTVIVNQLVEQDRDNNRYQCNPIRKRIKSMPSSTPPTPPPIKLSPIKPMYAPVEKDDNRFLYLLVILLIVYIVSIIIECNNKVKLRSIIALTSQ
jgi:hypothetical protein